MKNLLLLSLTALQIFASSITIKDHNKVSTLDVEFKNNKYYLAKNNTKSFGGNKLIIRVKDVTPSYMNQIENTYGLKNTAILVTNDYIYKTNGNISIFDICEDLSNDSNIISIKPLIKTRIE